MDELDAMRELNAMLVRLFATAQNLAPGPDRNQVLKEIDLMRQRLDAIVSVAEDRK